jgi:HEAT repeat protein
MALTVDYETATLEEVEDLLDHDSPFVRGDAACVCGDRLRTKELTALPPSVRSRLVRMLDDKEVLPRVEAAITLAETHDPVATPVLLAAIRSSKFRLDATRALGASGDPRAIPELTNLMQRWLSAWADKLQAAAALCTLGDPGGAAYLEGKLESRRSAERAAALHFVGECRHPRALELLSRTLADPRDGHRDVAARALGILGDRRGRDFLAAARHNADPELAGDIDRALALLEAPSR